MKNILPDKIFRLTCLAVLFAFSLLMADYLSQRTDAAQQVINVGATPNDGAGDPLRTAFIKATNNFNELYPWITNLWNSTNALNSSVNSLNAVTNDATGTGRLVKETSPTIIGLTTAGPNTFVVNSAMRFGPSSEVTSGDKVLITDSSIDPPDLRVVESTLTRQNAGLLQTQFQNITNARLATIGITIDGNGSTISAGTKGYISIPYACTILSVTMLADTSGSAVVDIWKDSYANYPPTDADSITASAVPTISSAIKSQDTTLTGWTTSVSENDTIAFNVDSASTITRLTITLKVRK